MATPPRLGEFVATLALAQDNAFGQPLESQLRSCLLATWMCDAAEFEKKVRETVYWVALLRYVGCTGHAHEVATVFGDEIAIRAQTLVHGAANPAEVMRDVVAFATAGRAQEEREQIVRMIQQTAREWAVHNFASGCEVADMLVRRLDFGPDVREALRFTFERWNGNGYPAHASGDNIPLAMRIVHLSHDMEAIGRLFSPDQALDAARDRRDRTYDPRLTDLFVAHGRTWFDRLDKIEPWDAVLELEPMPRRMLEGDALDDALAVAADFVDLKSRTWRDIAVGARNSAPTPPDCGDAARVPSPSFGGLRWCTTSARPRCRTRSGTSPVRSRVRSSIVSNCTRC